MQLSHFYCNWGIGSGNPIAQFRCGFFALIPRSGPFRLQLYEKRPKRTDSFSQ